MKEFYTYEQQILKLKNEGLIINNIDSAMKFLKLEGYYNIINGYSCFFKSNKRFIQDTTFEDIKALYNFDKNFKSIIYKYIITIENHVKSLIAYEFSKNHGVDEKIYLTRKNFNNNQSFDQDVKNLIDICNNTINEGINLNSGKYRKYIEHSYLNHGHVPLWILVLALTFGNVSKFYTYMKTEEKNNIANIYNLNSRQFANVLKILVSFRNIVAHGERLFCTKLPKLRLIELPIKNKITLPEGNYGKCDAFTLFIIFKYTLPMELFENFIKDFKIEYDQLNTVFENKKDIISIIKKEMGLLEIWQKLPIISKD